jgi:LysM repeat protein
VAALNFLFVIFAKNFLKVGRKPYSGIICLLVLLLAASCRTAKIPTTPAVVSGTASGYIEAYKGIAVSEMKRSGVPASITLAQGMLESDYGRSTLARMGNNHFGIKCHNDWRGQTIRQHDDRRNECFRKYQKAEDSFYDHSDFLRSGSRYSFLFDLDPKNYKAWAHGLKKAGYATNPDYAGLLIRKIEENRLYLLDESYTASGAGPHAQSRQMEIQAKQGTGTAAQKAPVQEVNVTFGAVMARVPRIQENNKLQYIIVKEGDTREKIEKEFQMLRWELARYNELKSDFVPVTGQILYLQPKRDKAEAGKDFHTVADGDTMYKISQIYGIQLGYLLEMNRMQEGTEPVPGQKIWLRNIKPAG